ncbi:hypothetical protein [Roseateles sp. P5_D6]
MTELRDSPLATPPENKVFYALHRIGSRLVGDLFLASYLSSSLNLVNTLGPLHRAATFSGGEKQGLAPELLDRILAQQDDTMRWVADAKAEGYHRTNVLAFLSLWAAHEAGHENVMAAILETVRSSALAASAKFKRGRFDVDDWPWSEDRCLDLAQRLDQKAKEVIPDGGWDAAGRLATAYGWLGCILRVPPDAAETFNEASMVRNVLLHRYGRLSGRDIQRAPHLATHANGAIQLSEERLKLYYRAVVAVLNAATEAVAAAGWR